MILSYLSYRNACSSKQAERQNRIAQLPDVFRDPLTASEIQLLNLPISELASRTREGLVDPNASLLAYSKRALQAHAELNCLTEVMISDAQTWARDCNKQGPLAGVPVSLKDTVGVKGWDSSIGYSERVKTPMAEDSAIIRLLRDLGAVPFVKTNVPITLLAFESNSDLFGRTKNPHNKDYSPGGSTGGEAALLAYGGSRIGIGTDVAGSVRIPAHYSGIYSIKSSTGRFPRMGGGSSIPGQEGIPGVNSPMARTLTDLETFWKAIVNQEPWQYDHSCHPIPWRELDLSSKKLKWGVMWDDGVIAPSPACHRALKIVTDILLKHGHIVKAIDPPSPLEGLKIGFQLLLADGGKTVTRRINFFESNDPGVAHTRFLCSLPRWIKRIYIWYLRYIRRDETSAGLIQVSGELSVVDYMPVVAKREAYRKKWFDMWKNEELDFVLTVPHSLPAVPHGGLKQSLVSYGYTFLFNVLDYTAGVLPITKVDPALDVLPSTFRSRNGIESDAYRVYDSVKMAGLPIGVEVVGKRLQEEKVMEGMKIIERYLREDALQYELLPVKA